MSKIKSQPPISEIQNLPLVSKIKNRLLVSKICHYCLKSIFSHKCTNQKSDPSCWLRLTLSKIHLVFKIKFHPNLIVLAPEPALILLRDIFCIKLHFNLKISSNVMNKKIRYLSSSIYEKITTSVWLSGYQCGPIWACDRSFLSNRMLTTRRFTFQNKAIITNWILYQYL